MHWSEGMLPNMGPTCPDCAQDWAIGRAPDDGSVSILVEICLRTRKYNEFWAWNQSCQNSKHLESIISWMPWVLNSPMPTPVSTHSTSSDLSELFSLGISFSLRVYRCQYVSPSFNTSWLKLMASPFFRGVLSVL